MLISIETIADDIRLGLCTIEPQTRMLARNSERAAVRGLIASMLGSEDFVLRHTKDGKPLLTFGCRSLNISISHTRGYAAVMLSERHVVGVDIEYRSDRVRRIASRFMRDDELEPIAWLEADEQLRIELLTWCAKEAVYKLFSEDHLTYYQMRVRLMATTPQQTTTTLHQQAVSPQQMQVDNLLRNQTVPASFRYQDDFALVYTYLPQ